MDLLVICQLILCRARGMRITGRAANFFVCLFSSLRNLPRSVKPWRKEMWNGVAVVPQTKGRSHRHRSVFSAPSSVCIAHLQ